jgi:phenylacetate-CoA ligase
LLLRALYHFAALKRHLSLRPSALAEHQQKKLIAIIQHAYENVPFYRQKFDSVGITPRDIRSIDDLGKLPVTTKAELQRCGTGEVLARHVAPHDCVHLQTSGSSGRPLDIYLNPSASDHRFAMMARVYWENGLRPWHRMALLQNAEADLSFTLPKFRGVVRRLEVPRTLPVTQQLDILKSYHPDFIASNPSSLVPIANRCLEHKTEIRPQLVVTNSELLVPEHATLIRSVFDCDSVDEYSSFEMGPMSWECTEHMGYHINVDGVVLEFLDKHGDPVAPGERGSIICTSLDNYAMPFIRYQINDIGVPSSTTCTCGCPLPLMKIVEGRTDDFFTTTDGRMISPLALERLSYLGDTQGLTQFRVIQDTATSLTIQLAGLNAPLDHATMSKVRSKLQAILGADLQVQFQFVNQLDRDPSGKLRAYISHVTPSQSSPPDGTQS